MPNTKPIGVAYEDPQLNAAILGKTSALSGTVGFYGKVPIVQRPYTASVHNTTALASSTDFAAAQLAVVHELMKTMIGLGIYATV